MCIRDSYRNIYFASGSEAGKFALNIMAFPTTYVSVYYTHLDVYKRQTL